MFTVTKTYRDFPAVHRQPNHEGHCRLIHGHNWGWDIVFQSDQLDRNGFVIDVGTLQPLKKFLEYHFDHTFLINATDPQLPYFRHLNTEDLAKIVVVPNCGMEGLALFVFVEVSMLISEIAPERSLRVVEVTCWEDSKNRATYRPI